MYFDKDLVPSSSVPAPSLPRHTPLRVRLIRELEVPPKSTQNELPGLHRQQPPIRVRWQDRSHPTACALPAVICHAAAGGSDYLQGRCSSWCGSGNKMSQQLACSSSLRFGHARYSQALARSEELRAAQQDSRRPNASLFGGNL